MFNLLIFIVILSILIVVHEFGHFLAARRYGVGVEKFAIGFGPVIFQIKGKATDFLVCLFPLGGYVKLAGETRQDCQGQRDEFYSKPVGVKTRIVLAGPMFNFLLAFVLFWAIAVIGFPRPDYANTVVGEVLQGYPAASAGLEEGDRIVIVNGKKVNDWLAMKAAITKSDEEVSLLVDRSGNALALTLGLKDSEYADDFGQKKSQRIIGIVPPTINAKYNIFVGFFKAFQMLFSMTYFMAKGFLFIILGILPFKEAVAGPIGIFYITSEAVKIGIVAILHLMAVLNVSLTIVNLMPLPLMDGGHAFLFLIERIRKKRLSEKIEEIIARVGFAMLGLLIVFVFYNDVIKFGSKIWPSKNAQQVEEVVEEQE
ncbi:MAG: site-2 protease family protein [Candidatus Omnitrophica bacterium]|nr:site-2 protease family protein [Candidatus Omnitrophota bacterium]